MRFPVLLFEEFALDHQCRQDRQWSLGLIYSRRPPVMGKFVDHRLQGVCDGDGVGLPGPSTHIPVNVISFGSLTSHSWLSKSSYPPLPPGTAPPQQWLLLLPGPASDRVSENPAGRKLWSRRHLNQSGHCWLKTSASSQGWTHLQRFLAQPKVLSNPEEE